MEVANDFEYVAGYKYLTLKTFVQQQLEKFRGTTEAKKSEQVFWDPFYTPYMSCNEVDQIESDIKFQLQREYLNLWIEKRDEELQKAEIENKENLKDFQEFVAKEKKHIQGVILTQEARIIREDVERIVNRKFKYQFIQGLRLVYEQWSLLLLLFSVVVKCNIVSIIYLLLVLNYIRSSNKSKAMIQQAKVIGTCICIQYWLYLFNITSHSAVQRLPVEPYPSVEEPTGIYFIPAFYKYEFFTTNFENSYFFAMGVEPATINNIMIDFLNLAVAAMYVFYCKNPVLSRKTELRWCYNHYDWVKDKCVNQENKVYQKTEKKIKSQKKYSALMTKLRRLNQIKKLEFIATPGELDFSKIVDDEAQDKCKDCIKNEAYLPEEV